MKLLCRELAQGWQNATRSRSRLPTLGAEAEHAIPPESRISIPTGVYRLTGNAGVDHPAIAIVATAVIRYHHTIQP